MRKAMLRLEDIGPGGAYESEESLLRLKAIGHFLHSRGIPFHIAVIPRYLDPVKGIDRSIDQAENPYIRHFLEMLSYMIQCGASLGMHGCTHQYGATVSGEGYEFSGKECDASECPPDDSAVACYQQKEMFSSYAFHRFREGLSIFHRAGLTPDWFEAPHYTASTHQRCILEACMDLFYENPPSTPNARRPMLLDKDSEFYRGVLYVPTPLFYVDGSSPQKDVQRMTAEMKSYRKDDLASFFYHPFLEFPFIRLSPSDGEKMNTRFQYEENSYLDQLIRDFTQEGYKFVSINSLFPYCPDFRKTGFFPGKDTEFHIGRSADKQRDELLIRQKTTGTWYTAQVRLSGDTRRENGIESVVPVLSGWKAGGDEEAFIGDFNGDGRDDIALWNRTLGTLHVALRSGKTFRPSGEWLRSQLPSGDWRLITGDFNGDGFEDFLAWTTGAGKLAISRGDHFDPWSDLLGFSEFGASWQPFAGDYNGDGRLDLALWNTDTGEWKVFLNISGGQFRESGSWSSNWTEAEGWIVRMGDANGDGRTDLFGIQAEKGMWMIALCNGHSIDLPETEFGPWAAGGGEPMIPLIGHFTDCGKAALLAIHPLLRGGTIDAARPFCHR